MIKLIDTSSPKTLQTQQEGERLGGMQQNSKTQK